MPDHGNRPLTFPVLGCWRPSLLHAASNSGHAIVGGGLPEILVSWFSPRPLCVNDSGQMAFSQGWARARQSPKMLLLLLLLLLDSCLPKHTDVTSSSCHRFSCLIYETQQIHATTPSWRLAQPPLPSLPVPLQRCRSPKGHTRGGPHRPLARSLRSVKKKTTQETVRYAQTMTKRARRIKVR